MCAKKIEANTGFIILLRHLSEMYSIKLSNRDIM